MQTELILEEYKVQSTGAGGGHHYILTEIQYKGRKRNLVILFASKTDERKLKENKRIRIKGDLEDEGEKYDLIMSNTTLIK